MNSFIKTAIKKLIKKPFHIKRLAVCVIFFQISTFTTLHAGPLDGPEIAGEWSPVYNGDIVAIHMVMMPTGKVLTYAEGGQGRPLLDEIRIWDPVNLTLESPTLPPYDLFCSGHSVLPDGRIFIQGGHDEADAHGQSRATIYNPFTDSWDDSIPNMNSGRWYATSTILPNGDILVLNGAIDSYTNKNALPQIWQLQTNSWRNLITAEEDDPMGIDFYPRMFVAPDGRVFKAGPDNDTWFLDTAGTGQWTRGPDMKWGSFRGYSAAVEFEEGRILVMGGGDSPPTNTVEMIDLNDANPQWEFMAPMHHARRHLNATILADGKILVTSGTSAEGFNNGDGMVTIAEIYDPETNTWEEVAEQNIGRAYHSNAVLLPDGRVLVGGGGRPAADGGVDNPNLEIYSPPYLFQGARPEITAAPSALSFGQTFDIATPNAEDITAVHLIRLGAATHSFDQTQAISRLNFSKNTSNLTVEAPVDPNRAQPGHYMLFILADGIPSEAHMVQFGDAEPPTSPTNLTHDDISPTQILLRWQAARDNIKVSSYSVYLNGDFLQTVTEPELQINYLDSSSDYTITIIARDLYGNESISSEALNLRTLDPGLNEPTPVAGEDITVAIDQDFMLDGSRSSDIDGQLLTYEWLLDGEIVATTPIIRTSLPVEGTYEYQLNVSDGDFTVSDTLVVTVVSALNVIINGDFEAGMEGWYGEAQAGTATFSADDGRGHIDVITEGQNTWSTQIAQNISLVAGTTYTLDFDIQSDSPTRRFSVIVEEIGIWTPYLSKALTLNKPVGEAQHFTLQWTQSVTTNNAKIGFHVGATGSDDIWLDNVFLGGGETDNLPPQSLAGPDTSGYLNFQVQLNGSESFDPDERPSAITFEWLQTSGTPVTLSDTTIAAPFFTPTVADTYTFTLTVTDGEFSHTDEVIIIAQELNNTPPTANAGSSQNVALGQEVNLNGSNSYDSDAAPLPISYQWRQLTGPAISLSDWSAATPFFTPTEVGSYTFGLTLFDGDAYSSESLVTVNVANVTTQNLLANGNFVNGLDRWQPLILDGALAQFSVDDGVLNLAIENSGTNNWSLQIYQLEELIGGTTYTLSFEATVPELPRDIRVVIEHNGAPFTGYINQIVTPSQAGLTETFEVQWVQPVDDPVVKIGFHFGNNTVNNPISLDNIQLIEGVSADNIGPVANAGLNQRSYIDTLITFDGSFSVDFDRGPEPLSYLWQQVSGPTIELADNNTTTPSFTPTEPGIYTFSLTLNDGDLASLADEVTVVVTTLSNIKPTANAGADQHILLGNSVTLDGSASFDTDALPGDLSYTWQQISGPDVNLWNRYTRNPLFTPVVSGAYVFGLVVNDGDLDSETDTIIIHVNEPNLAPVADAGFDRRVYEGDEVIIDGTRSIDPDNGPEPLRFYWEQIGGESVSLDITNPTQPRFTAGSPGEYRFSVFVFDGEIMSLVDDVTFEVLAIPNIPPISIASESPEKEDFIGNPITLDGNQSYDPDNAPSPLTYEWEQISGPAVTLDDPLAAVTQWSTLEPGRYTFKLTTHDGVSASDQLGVVPERSLLVTDKAILNHFPLKTVLQTIIDDGGDYQTTPAEMILDLANVRDNCDEFNGFPQHNSDDTPGFCSNPGASMDQFQALFDTELSYYRPIALINRFDLAEPDGRDCGEYRIAYAGNDFTPRVNFFIFEARLPNPYPEQGLQGCHDAWRYWADLSHDRMLSSRAEKLKTFFFDGIPGFAPALKAAHFTGENKGSGAIRLNARTDQQSNWVFMQFRLQLDDNCAPLCTVNVEQEGLKDTPFPGLAGNPEDEPLAQAFQDAVLSAINTPGQQLLAESISKLSIDLPIATYLGRQHSGLEQKPGVIEAMSPAFESAIAEKLASAGSNLTPQNIITRVNALTCAGCHNQHSTDLGAPLELNSANQFTEFLSQQEELGPDGPRFKIKSSMQEFFLPSRTAQLEEVLDRSTVHIVINDIDRDNDGVYDSQDQCLASPTGAVVDALGCTLYIDLDGDKVPDARDVCTGTLPDTPVDVNGCKLTQSIRIEAENFTSFKEKDKHNSIFPRKEGYDDEKSSTDWLEYGYPSLETYLGEQAHCKEGVDLYPVIDEGVSNVAIGCIRKGEKLHYTESLSPGLYKLFARVSSYHSNGLLKVKMHGFSTRSFILSTESSDQWVTQEIGILEIPEGKTQSIIKASIIEGGFNLNWLQFEALSFYELDSDYDGVIDDKDRCPNSLPGIKVNRKGCKKNKKKNKTK